MKNTILYERIKRLLLPAIVFAFAFAAYGFVKKNPKAASSVSHQTQDNSAPVVYFTGDISADRMQRVFQAMDWSATGTTGVKCLVKGNYVGSRFKNYDSFFVISHFKGHAMAGFSSAIKNTSIGFASGQSTKDSGKVYIHSGGGYCHRLQHALGNSLKTCSFTIIAENLKNLWNAIAPSAAVINFQDF